jgi:Tfp pilus assembly protein PilN
VVQQVGLKPYLMDIKPLALARLVPEPTAIMLDVQAKEFDIVVMIDGTPQPIRTVPFSEAAQSLSDRLPAVVDELKRTILFYNSNYPDRPIPADIPLYVSGELAADEELSRSLAQAVGYRTLPLPVPFKLPKQKIDPSPYLVNIGLALKESSGEARPLRPNINTLPVPYQPRQISLGKLMALPAVAVAIGLIVMLSMTVQDAAGSIYDVQTRLDTTKAVLDKRQAQKKDLTAQIAVLEQELAGARTARDAFAAVLDGINRDGDRIDGDLKAAVGNVVTALELTNIVHSGKALEISGTAPSEAEVLAYARNLYATGRFAELTITNVTRKESTGEVVVTENTTAPRVWVEFILDLKLKAAE